MLLAAIVDEMEVEFHLIHDSSSIVWQYLKLYAQFCAPDDGGGTAWNK